MKEEHPGLMIEQAVTEHIKMNAVYMNTYGTSYDSQLGAYYFFVGYSAHDGEKSSHSYGSAGKLINLDTPFIDCNIDTKGPCTYNNINIGAIILI